jgi:hypothetical protein
MTKSQTSFPLFLSLLIAMLGCNAAIADEIIINLFEQASPESNAELNKICSLDIEYDTRDSIAKLEFHKIYRSTRNCREGQKARVCAAFIIGSAEQDCIGPIFVSGGVIRLDTSRAKLVEEYKNRYRLLSEVYGSEFGVPYLTQTVVGGLLLIESGRNIYLIKTE